VSIGLAMAAIGFNVQHDGGHKAYAASRWQNALAAASLDFIGASSYVWSYKHNVFHHSNPNCVGLDPDIDLQPLCRLAPAQASHRWQRFQHVYIWFLYAFLAVKWLFDDFRDVYLGTVGGRHFPRPKGAQLAQFCAGKLFFVSWSVVLPLLLHPARNVALGWATASVTISLALATVFQMAHVVEQTGFTTPATEKTPWAEHQVATTANFAPGAPLITWLVGGLNHQIEHHLFPSVCHVRLPALAPIVKATCEEFGVPYLEYPTAGAALAAHVRWLRAMGAPAAQPASSGEST
jgi:linoleoyl-CoA desaturase